MIETFSIGPMPNAAMCCVPKLEKKAIYRPMTFVCVGEVEFTRVADMCSLIIQLGAFQPPLKTCLQQD